MKVYSIKDIPLRKRKKARTQLELIYALKKRLNRQNFSSITIEELCDDVQISRGTFFNYFPQKTDMIIYNALLWNLEARWLTTMSSETPQGLKAIEKFFIWFAKKIEKHPQMFLELIALRSSNPKEFIRFEQKYKNRISHEVRLLHFPDLGGIETVPEGDYSITLRIHLVHAIQKGELPDNSDIDTAIISLGIILYGAPILATNQILTSIEQIYLNQLNLLFKGLGASFS